MATKKTKGWVVKAEATVYPCGCSKMKDSKGKRLKFCRTHAKSGGPLRKGK